MSFDPYQAWLGLPAGRRPENFYELLGLKLFESEPPVIAEALNSRKATVQAQVSGPQAAAAKQLLMELDMAKAALMTGAARREYEANLRAQLGMAPAAARPTPAAVAPVAAQPVATVAQPVAVPVAAVAVPVAPMAAQPTPMAAQVAPATVAMPVEMASPAVPSFMGGPQGIPSSGGAASIKYRARRSKSSAATAMVLLFAAIACLGAVAAYAFKDDIFGPAPLAQAPAQVAVPAAPSTAGAVKSERKYVASSNSTEPEGPSESEKVGQSIGQMFMQSTFPAPEVATTPQPGGFAAPRRGGPMNSTPTLGDPVEMRKPGEGLPPPAEMAKSDKAEVKPREPYVTPPAGQAEVAAIQRDLKQMLVALGERNVPKAEIELDLATINAYSSDTIADVATGKKMIEASQRFWDAVRDGTTKVAQNDALTVDGESYTVTKIEETKIGFRTPTGNREFLIDKLPSPVARALAEKSLSAGDAQAWLTMAVFLSVDSKGNAEAGQKLFDEAKAAGAADAEAIQKLIAKLRS